MTGPHFLIVSCTQCKLPFRYLRKYLIPITMSKTFLVTGAAGNLGSAVTDLLLKEGHQVIGTFVPGHDYPNSEVDFRPCDLTNSDDTEDFFVSLKKSHQKIDGVVMLVGGFSMGNLLSTHSNDINKMISLNLMTAYNTSKYATDWMHNNGGTKLIFVGAKPAIEGGASGVLSYAISKSAVIKLAEIINEDEDLKDIHASVIIPSIIDTPPNRASMPDANFNDWVTPQEIAENISFLLSDKANPLRETVLKLYKNS